MIRCYSNTIQNKILEVFSSSTVIYLFKSVQIWQSYDQLYLYETPQRNRRCEVAPWDSVDIFSNELVLSQSGDSSKIAWVRESRERENIAAILDMTCAQIEIKIEVFWILKAER